VGFQTFDGWGRWAALESANFGVLVLRSHRHDVGDLRGWDYGSPGFRDCGRRPNHLRRRVDNFGPGATLMSTFTRMLPAK